MFFIGFDFGGTKIEAMLIHFGNLKKEEQLCQSFEYQKTSGEIIPAFILLKKRVATERHFGYEQILEKMVKLVHEICSERKIELNSLSGIGLSVPGPVHPETQIITSSNTMVVVGHNMQIDLQLKLRTSIPIVSENDANCFALAEAFCGAGLKYFKETTLPVSQHISMGLILGSGFGGGLIINGNIISGRRGGTGEVGHMTLYRDGWPCYCGRQGCAEQYLSGPALEASLNNRMYSQIEKRPGAAKIFDLFKDKDPIAIAVVKQYKKDLAFFLGSLTCFSDLHYFVLGGGLSLQDALYEDLEEEIGRNTYLPKEKISVYKHQIGDTAGAIGAVLKVIAQQKLHF